MTIAISNTSNSQVWGTYQNRLNQLATLMSTNVVTADATSGGSLTSGNVAVNGYFTANTVSVTNIQGGTANTPALLTVSSNVSFNYNLINIVSITANSTNSQFTFNSNNISLLNTTVITGNATFSNNITFGNILVGSNLNTNNIIANTVTTGAVAVNTTAIAVGANVSVNASQLTVGNLTANTTTLNVANLLANGISVNTFSAAVSVGVGANVSVSTSGISVGNSTVNTTVNSSVINTANLNANNLTANNFAVGVSVVNTTAIAVGANSVLTTGTLTIGNSSVNTVINSTAVVSAQYISGIVTHNATSIAIGANVLLNSGSLAIGNSTVNAVINSTFLNIANVTVTSNLLVSGTLVVNGVAFTGTTNASLILYPLADNANAVGNSTYRFANVWSVNTFANTATITGSVVVGANVSINTTAFNVGNSTVNSTHTSTTLGVNAITANLVTLGTTVVNSSIVTLNGTANLNATSLTIGTAVVNTTALALGNNNITLANANFNAPYLRMGIGNSGFGQIKIQANNYSVMMRNDDVSAYLMQTASGSATGDVWNSFRPFQWNLTTGVVNIDSTNQGVAIGAATGSNNALTGYTNSGIGVYGISNTNVGVQGVSVSAAGVFGQSNSYPGVEGVSNVNNGVFGQSNTGYGGYFVSNTNSGVYATSNTGNGGWFVSFNNGVGVYGTSNSSYGVYGLSNSSYGVVGQSNTLAGVYGLSNTNSGVYGLSNSGVGVYGLSNTQAGVFGQSNSSYGGYFQSNSYNGVYGQSNSSYGVYGLSNTSIGVYGYSNTGYGLFAQSNGSSIAAFANTTAVISYIDSQGVYQGSANNTLHLGGSLPAAFQTTAGLSANVATLTSNNSTNFAGQGQAYYANVTSYPGAFNGTSITTSGITTHNANLVVNSSYTVAQTIIATSNNINVNCAVGNFFTATCNGSAANIYFTNSPTTTAYSFILVLANGGTNTISWANTPKWPAATAPSASSNTDVWVFFTRDGGTTWRGNLVQRDSR